MQTTVSLHRKCHSCGRFGFISSPFHWLISLLCSPSLFSTSFHQHVLPSLHSHTIHSLSSSALTLPSTRPPPTLPHILPLVLHPHTPYPPLHPVQHSTQKPQFPIHSTFLLFHHPPQRHVHIATRYVGAQVGKEGANSLHNLHTRSAHLTLSHPQRSE